MTLLGDWADAPALVLSCPGPLRRHSAALCAVDGLALPQALLGGESQLLAFAALGPAGRMWFAPFPEMFADAGRLARALGTDGPADGVVHLRFGGVRSARVLKGARNAAVLAEQPGAPLLTASHHPFASGLVLPAAMLRAWRLAPDVVAPARAGGAPLAMFDLPGDLVRAPLPAGVPGAPGLEAVCLDSFASDAWAAGHVGHPPACPPDGTPAVLVPWNMDHPGSVLPELLARLARLAAPGAAQPRIVLLPFNYIGQTGIIRDMIARIEAAAGAAALRRLFLARVRSADGMAALRRLSRVAWVDGNDPEHWWTLGRLAACGVTCLVIGGSMPDTAPELADETLRVAAETRYGALIFQARLPTPRRLGHLLRLTAEAQTAQPPDTALMPPPANARAQPPGAPEAATRATRPIRRRGRPA